MADMFWDQPTDSVQEETNPPRRRARRARTPRRPNTSEPPAGQTDDRHDQDDDTPEGRLRAALRRVVLDDAAGWHAALRAAGFSDAECRRLIFERLQPRAEGRARVS
jgi:hypothetical protein